MIFHELRKIKEGNAKIIGVNTPGVCCERTIHKKTSGFGCFSRYPFMTTENVYTEYGFYCFDAQASIIFRAHEPRLKKLLCNKIKRIININT